MKRFKELLLFLYFVFAIFVECRANHFCSELKKLKDSPLIYACDHFLSDEECDYIIALSKDSLARTTVVDSESEQGVNDEARTSFGTFLDMDDELLFKIEEKIAEVTKIPKERGENFQILYYDVGGEYKPHFDTFDVSTPGGRIHYNRGGQRVATFLVYLNTPKKGGETVFPKAKIKIIPKKGRAVLFYNVDSLGNVDPMSLHGGAPVIEGEKWLMTRWLREKIFQ